MEKSSMNCLLCRKRKLKCDREKAGCSHCRKSDLPCVYPEPEPTGIKRRRGPYKKDKPPRERHLEDLVKYLEPRGNKTTSLHDGRRDLWRRASVERSLQGTSQCENLVKDALTALTQSSAGYDADSNHAVPNRTNSKEYPSLSRIVEYWHLFRTKVDPLTKVVHAPTLEKEILTRLTDLENTTGPFRTLLFAVYFSAVSACTSSECKRRFNQNRLDLQAQYSRAIEVGLVDYGAPALESLQALVLYITTVRRSDLDANIQTLFSLAVRMAQMIGLQEDPGSSFPPFEAQLRRRLWWQICGLESRSAEEGDARMTSIMEDRNVLLPANLLDEDMDPKMPEPPEPRAGVTDMTFVLTRLHIIALVHELWKAKRWHRTTANYDLRQVQHSIFREKSREMETRLLQHLHPSRPYDRLCASFVQAMLWKARLLIDHPFGQQPSKDTTPEERLQILKASVKIISITHTLPLDRRLADYAWFFSGFIQWHAFAIVVAELGYSKNEAFNREAWAIVAPILEHWDSSYKGNRDGPAWDHVNTLICRARAMRMNDGAAIEPAHGFRAHNATSVHPHHRHQPQVTGTRYILDLDLASSASFDDASFDVDPVLDLGSLENLENIDFGAFDTVFGSIEWA